MPDDRQSDAEVARQAAIQSLVSNLVYLAVLLGFSVALTRRDWVARQIARARAWGRPKPFEPGDAFTELRRDIARFEGREP